MNTIHTFLRPGRVAGFSLIEVLIALVILSVGLLGIAAMVSVSLKAKDSSYMQTQATSLAQNILDRMRANHGAAETGNYNTSFSTTYLSPPACVGSGITCSPAQMATFDLADWKADIANTLPSFSSGTSAQGEITTVAVAQMTQVTISIRWNDQRANAALSSSTTAAPAAATTTFTLTSGL